MRTQVSLNERELDVELMTVNERIGMTTQIPPTRPITTNELDRLRTRTSPAGPRRPTSHDSRTRPGHGPIQTVPPRASVQELPSAHQHLHH